MISVSITSEDIAEEMNKYYNDVDTYFNNLRKCDKHKHKHTKIVDEKKKNKQTITCNELLYHNQLLTCGSPSKSF